MERLTSSPGLVVRDPERTYLQPWIVARLAAIGEQLRDLGLTVRVHDGSGPTEGGRFPPHRSHRTGRDLDVLPARRGELVRSAPEILRLVELLADDLEVVGATDGLETSAPVRVARWPGHRTHVHLRFRTMPKTLSQSITSAAVQVLQGVPLADRRLSALAAQASAVITSTDPGAIVTQGADPWAFVKTPGLPIRAVALAWLALAYKVPAAAVGDGKPAAAALPFVGAALRDVPATGVYVEWVRGDKIGTLEEVAAANGKVAGRAAAAAASAAAAAAGALFGPLIGRIIGAVVGFLGLVAVLGAVVWAVSSSGGKPAARSSRARADDDAGEPGELAELRREFRRVKKRPPPSSWSAERLRAEL